jgi:hypothetical protein
LLKIAVGVKVLEMFLVIVQDIMKNVVHEVGKDITLVHNAMVQDK